MSADYDNFYENAEEVSRRLDASVVLYDGHPCFVARSGMVTAGGKRDGIVRLFLYRLPYDNGDPVAVALQDLEEGEPLPEGAFRKKINSPKFNGFRPFDMGYCNLFSDERRGLNFRYPCFVARTAMRRGKQGFSENSAAISANKKEGFRIPFRSLIWSEAFVEMVLNRYPSFDQAWRTLTNATGLAVSRNFALIRDEAGITFLEYKRETVGIVRNGEILLTPKYMYLREEIIECPNLPNMVNNY